MAMGADWVNVGSLARSKRISIQRRFHGMFWVYTNIEVFQMHLEKHALSQYITVLDSPHCISRIRIPRSKMWWCKKSPKNSQHNRNYYPHPVSSRFETFPTFRRFSKCCHGFLWQSHLGKLQNQFRRLNLVWYIARTLLRYSKLSQSPSTWMYICQALPSELIRETYKSNIPYFDLYAHYTHSHNSTRVS